MMSRGPTPTETPGSDVSPRTQPAPKGVDYFAHRPKRTSPQPTGNPSGLGTEAITARTTLSDGRAGTEGEAPVDSATDVKGKQKEVEIPADASATTAGDSASSNTSSEPPSRKASVSSISFLAPRNPSLPQGNKRPHGAGRIRGASPPHRRSVEKQTNFCVMLILSSSLLTLPPNSNFPAVATCFWKRKRICPSGQRKR